MNKIYIKNYISLLILVVLFSGLSFAKGIKISTGFKIDDYGTCYYYEEDKYYRDGFHLIDSNCDGNFE